MHQDGKDSELITTVNPNQLTFHTTKLLVGMIEESQSLPPDAGSDNTIQFRMNALEILYIITNLGLELLQRLFLFR